ncbi:hypothetical protein C5615_10650 [Burkholderia cepacia]|uniref:Transposase IS116/IS110/IS902 C-terminal domain-containing protein n=1 Tax=Burkholderia cepacia TaxID=292 RepID=A0A2S8IWD2_BURCE|nr:hypothetical protein C5615_10650 [Burkholderia cepacia]HDR9507211.1 IS110 family transposase [Burkholderia cepacia]
MAHIAINRPLRSVEPGWIPIISTRDSLPDWSQNSASGQTAIVSAVGNASTFRRARDLAAWVGLVPQQHTTGGKPRLLGITKRGNSYLRRLFVQGARALWVWKDKHPNDPIQHWLIQLAERRHAHIAVCALANKLVRIAWAVMRSGAEFNLHYHT